jgi:hypothetical protein
MWLATVSHSVWIPTLSIRLFLMAEWRGPPPATYRAPPGRPRFSAHLLSIRKEPIEETITKKTFHERIRGLPPGRTGNRKSCTVEKDYAEPIRRSSPSHLAISSSTGSLRNSWEDALKVALQGLGLSGRLNTAYIERVNLTIRHGIAALARRTWATAKPAPHLLAHLEWWRADSHGCRVLTKRCE